MINSQDGKLVHTAAESDDGLPLREVLKRAFKPSTAFLRALKKVSGGITVNDMEATTALRIKKGDRIALLKEPQEPNAEIIPEAMPLDIAYED